MANGCFKDAADLHAQIDQFAQAIARYEQVADQSLQSNLTKFSVKEYWLRSGLCALANQVRFPKYYQEAIFSNFQYRIR